MESKSKIFKQWNALIRKKTRDLENYILDKNKQVNFNKPLPEFNSIDSKELREKILPLTISEGREL